MLVLGFETSCDETAAAVVEDGKRILSSVVATQIPFHRQFSGVVPEIASRKHTEWILPVARKALGDAGCALSDIGAFAATNRPGLMGSLLVGLTFAKTIAWGERKPFIAVNHMLAHLYAAHLDRDIPYPYLGLLVSGGHSLICKVTGFDEIEVLGATVDDAAGEAFDKVAKFYGLGYPGGVVIDKLAQGGNPRAARFPMPNLKTLGKLGARGHCSLSYSGLKTAAINQLDRFWNPEFPRTNENIAAAFQEAAVKILTRSLFRAVDDTGLTTVVAGGGVAANSRLRAALAARTDLTCVFPPLKLCTDNGAMVAGVGYQYLSRGETSPWDVSASARIPAFKPAARRGKELP
ncbi:MAG: tRNA (adenosine(37)-N6)-threonylcarbamoyltransferase complex transferase subunit TsaD [Spirochaetaceae bacterium]|jgi:N6-L-threonylcarbamoyladenine synthase|nr:tRNA (adenosine(37)-N6)-threonylcarbamoyltransferase complex transferase subunit TsaD [Spirochaetaceae bacterium]